MKHQAPSTKLQGSTKHQTVRRKSWRCYHCDEVFTCPSAAAEHFGPTQYSRPLCQVPRKEIEDLEKQLREYRNEDTGLHRKIAQLESELRTELRRAEESGYAKGLRDAGELERNPPPILDPLLNVCIHCGSPPAFPSISSKPFICLKCQSK